MNATPSQQTTDAARLWWRPDVTILTRLGESWHVWTGKSWIGTYSFPDLEAARREFGPATYVVR